MELINKYIEEFNSISKTTKNLFADVTEEYFNKKLNVNKWSAGECINHLNITAGLYIPIISDTISKSDKNQASSPNYQPRYIVKFIINFFEPPYKFKMKTPSIFTPQKLFSMEETLDVFFMYQNKYCDLLKECNYLNLAAIKVASPLSRIIKFQIGEVFPFLSVHERRHLWQAEQVLKYL